MKINLIIFISEFNLGGAGNSLFKLCKNLPKNKFIISVICLNKCFYKSELKKLGIKLYEIPSKSTFSAMPKVKKITKNLIKSEYKNIFLSNIHFTNILSIIFLKFLDIKIILIERTPFEELFIYYNLLDFIKKNIIKILIRFTFNRADMCISNSKYISSKYNEYYNLRFKTIHPPSFKKIANFSFKKKKIKKKISIGVVSRLSKEKQINVIIKILSKFKDKITLQIFGTGPEEKKLKRMTQKLKLSQNVKFFGYRHPNKIKNVMKNFDYFINTSDFEGFPNSVVEALSAGIPVIASQSYGGINDIIKSKKYGLIYKNNYELNNILQKISKNKILFNFNKKILVRHLKSFSEEKNNINYQKIFLKI